MKVNSRKKTKISKRGKFKVDSSVSENFKLEFKKSEFQI